MPKICSPNVVKGLVSFLVPCCNQGGELRETIASARKAMGDLKYEIIVADEQSYDASCQGLEKDVLIIRNSQRYGVSHARRILFAHSRGDMLVWSDPHCRFPENCFLKMVEQAKKGRIIVEPRVTSGPGGMENRCGGKFKIGDRGINCARALRRPAVYPSLDGTIYVMSRETYEYTGGWPKLPGCWGYSEQAMTLLTYYLGIKVEVEKSVLCVHKTHHNRAFGRGFSFSVPKSDPAQNGYFFHKLFLPKTYEEMWLPALKKKWGFKEEWLQCFESKEFKQVQKVLDEKRVKTEEDFFKEVLGKKMRTTTTAEPVATTTAEPVATKPVGNIVVSKKDLTEKDHLDAQKKRSKPEENVKAHERVDKFLSWLDKSVPDGIKGKMVLDAGARDGYAAEQLLKKQASVVTGFDVVKEVADYAKSKGRPVVWANMQKLVCEDNAWDMVTCIHAIEHSQNPVEAVNELIRVLKVGGWLALAIPQESSPHEFMAHFSAFPNKDAVRELLLQNSYMDKSTFVESDYVTSDNKPEMRILAQKVSFKNKEVLIAPNGFPENFGTSVQPESKGFADRMHVIKSKKDVHLASCRKELAEVYNEIQRIKPKNFLEIGSYMGGSLYVLAGACAPEAKICSLDLGRSGQKARKRLSIMKEALKKEGFDAVWVRKNSHKKETFDKVQNFFGGSNVDVLHIDGDHSAEGTQKDYDMYSQLVKPGGLIVFHDIFIKTAKHKVHKIWPAIRLNGAYREICHTRYAPADQEQPNSQDVKDLKFSNSKPYRVGYGFLWKMQEPSETFKRAWQWVKENNVNIHQNPLEMQYAAEEVAKIQPKTFVEIGGYQGGSLYILSRFCKQGAKIVVVDPAKIGKDSTTKLQMVVDKLKNDGFEVEWVVKKSQDESAIGAVKNVIASNAVDVLHIDGDHRPNKTMADYKNFGPFVRSNGLIIFHDACAEPSRKSIRVIDCWKYVKPMGRAVEIRKDAPDPESGEIKRRGFGLFWVP